MAETTVGIDKGLIKALVESWGPSGFEHHVRARIRALVATLAEEVTVDAGGSLICRMGKKGGTKIMMAAHMDEIGLMIHHIDRDGYGRFSPIGGLFPLTLAGNRVRFEDGTIGVVGTDHMYTPTALPKVSDFYVDFSAGGSEPSGIQVGDVATMWREYEERGNRVIAKSLDDRIGCVVAIETMRRLAASGKALEHDLYFVFTTQEEVGIRGARTAAFGITPDMAIALDVTVAGDQPKGEKVNVRLGGGAAIKVRDVGHIVPPAIRALMVEAAEAAHIPYQLEVLDMGSTDASAIQITAAGIPSGAISIPCRFVHTTSETVDISDIQACVDLLLAIFDRPIDPAKF